MASTFQSPAPSLAQPSLDSRTGTATVDQPVDVTDARQKYLEEQRLRQSAQTPASQDRTPDRGARTPAVVTFTPYVDTIKKAQGGGPNLALLIVGGAIAYRLLKK